MTKVWCVFSMLERLMGIFATKAAADAYRVGFGQEGRYMQTREWPVFRE